MEPLISVIVPVYNGQDYILDCLKSIQQQTYRHLEIIVVNDGSTDDTFKLCEQAAGEVNHPERAIMAERCMKILTLSGKGVSAARNRALEMAQGEYVAFVDSDDRILPGMIQTLYDTICQTDSDVAGCRLFLWESEAEWKSGCEREQGDSAYETKVYAPEEYRKQEILKGNASCCTKLFSRRAIGDLRFSEGMTIGEDMLFLLHLHYGLKRISEISYVGYGYYQNPVSAMNGEFTKHVMDQITCWERAKELLPDEPQMDSFVLVAVLLVAGRIAKLDRNERKEYRDKADICSRKLKQYFNRQSFRYLDAGYKCKALLFRMAPAFYIELYHVWKKITH